MSDVPCNGCTRCCQGGDALRLLPGDDPAKWRTEPHPVAGHLMLAHKANGDCYYLGPAGCTIHDDRPQMCRNMDCRNVARALTYTKARKLSEAHVLPMAVWRRGRELLLKGKAGR